ncbi:hypothetical protein F2Q68_00014921 [Brassica cretica]|uniref:Uncharacterized protein n=2 Tax=Brassica cretica TaxID=69181 RepID=A0A3N6QLP5_BRACR|nr:hypothetical protein F2Q68_00014921 [Brassica cretica]KAF3586009.1 hypothetical protein F2Q69_00028607 [Brassica cretica]KAF3607894.1 hypothetical protein DY000_02047666 [Brassica cretica]
MMVVMVMENFVVQTQAQDTLSFRTCYPGCINGCAIEKQFPKLLLCPFTCLFTCLAPPTSNIPPPPSQMIFPKKIDHIDYFCKLGCATHHCASLSFLRRLSKFFSFYYMKRLVVCPRFARIVVDYNVCWI